MRMWVFSLSVAFFVRFAIRVAGTKHGHFMEKLFELLGYKVPLKDDGYSGYGGNPWAHLLSAFTFSLVSLSNQPELAGQW